MELFQSLYENTKNITKGVEDHQTEYIIKTVSMLDKRGHEILYFLIRMFHNYQNKEITFTPPYQSIVKNMNDVEFNLKDFPNQLQHMILMFVRMHYEYISYEDNRIRNKYN